MTPPSRSCERGRQLYDPGTPTIAVETRNTAPSTMDLAKPMFLSYRTKERIAWGALDLWPGLCGRDRATTRVGQGQRGERKSPSPRRIGIFSQWGIGDAVLATPLLTSLRRAYPDARIELIGKPWLADLFGDSALCDRVHSLVPPWTRSSNKYRVWESDWRRFARQLHAMGREPFDWLVSLRHDPREIWQLRQLSATFKVGYGGGGRRGLDLDLGRPPHLADRTHVSQDAVHAARVLTGDAVVHDQRPVLRVPPERSRQALERLRARGYRGGLVMAVSWGAGHPIRRWDPEKFAAVLRALPDRVGFITLLVEPGQEPPPIELPDRTPSARWQSSLAELAGLLSVTDLLLASDSGVMHIASACGCRVVTVFGPTAPEWFGPYDPGDRVVLVEPMPCRPCRDRCIYDRPVCMLGISHEQVSRAVDDVLSHSGRRLVDTLADPR